MGRKGDSKRKPKQQKNKNVGSNDSSGSVSSAMKASENQPALTRDLDKGAKKSSKK